MYESRCPKNAEVIFLFHQLQQGVNPGDESLVGLGIDGVGCKQFDAVAAVRDYVVRFGSSRERSTCWC